MLCLLVRRPPRCCMPDRQQSVRLATASREGDTSLSRAHHGCASSDGAGGRILSDINRVGARRDDGSDTRQLEAAHCDGHLPDALVVLEVHPGANACEDLQEVHADNARELEWRDEAHLDVYCAGADPSCCRLDGCSQVWDGHLQGVQIGPVHPL
eukprot:2910051-Pleurochrysis_carterae.AAC.2